MQERRGCLGCLGGCLGKVFFILLAAAVFVWALTATMNPWALHIGGQSTPLLYWHGMGAVHAKDGKVYPVYVCFGPGRPRGFHGGGRREGKIVSAHLTGTGWLCSAPGKIEKLNLSGTMYGGYTSDTNSLLSFRLLEWRKPFAINYQNRGFFDLAGQWRGRKLVLDRPNEQAIRFNTGPFLDNATATLGWASYRDFEDTCRRQGIP